jgi:hypothetical protein
MSTDMPRIFIIDIFTVQFILSYNSFIRIACAVGVEGHSFLIQSLSVFKQSIKKSTNG